MPPARPAAVSWPASSARRGSSGAGGRGRAGTTGQGNGGAPLAVVHRMKRSPARGDDMMTLARLHAALDSVVDTEQVMTQIHESSAVPEPTVTRVRQLVAEARELLRWMLARPEGRHVVGNPLSRQDPGVR
jgi:adenylosuccinate synthase